MSVYLDALKQCFFIPKPELTEKTLPDQAGRVFIVTGGYAGVGKELSKILYRKNGTVYVAGRSPDKGKAAIDEIKAAVGNSSGRLEFLKLDLADLPSIKASAEDFKSREQRLDVLTNNAGVMGPPAGSKSAQGYEQQIGTNCLGPYLFTQHLTPLLTKTASTSTPGSVRVTWAASLATMSAPSNGVTWDPTTSNPKTHGTPMLDYAQSKACNVLLARQYQRQHPSDGIVSNAWNPGNLMSELQRHQNALVMSLMRWMLSPPVYGAYTELFAGWAEEAGREERKGAYIGPWGRFVMLRRDVDESGEYERFWEWCERECRPYM